MRHALMQQGTLDVRFPPGMRKIQADTLRGDVIPAPDVFPAGEQAAYVRRASLERNICPSRAISSVETASVFRLWAEVKSSLLSTLRASTSPAVERYSCILLLKLPMSFTRSNIVSYPYLPATASRLELLSLNIVPP